jgi:hypothetical protein
MPLHPAQKRRRSATTVAARCHKCKMIHKKDETRIGREPDPRTILNSTPLHADAWLMCDCSSVGAATSEIQTASRISTAVAKKALDVQQEQGEAIVEMLSSAGAIAKANAEIQPSPGRVDVYG